MDKSPILAEKYAKAIFDYALEKDILETVDVHLSLMNDVFSGYWEAVEFLSLPIVDLSKKLKVIEEASEKSSLEQGLSNFLKLLVEKKRIVLFPLIHKKFRVFYNLHRHKVDVTVVAARPLSEEERQLFLHIWGTYLGMFLNLKEEVDEALIDGIKVYYRGYCYDATVKRRLELLREEMGKWN